MDNFDSYEENVQIMEFQNLIDESNISVLSYDELLRLLEQSIPPGYALNLDSITVESIEGGQRIRGVYYKVASC